jgi:hypothetical protein
MDYAPAKLARTIGGSWRIDFRGAYGDGWLAAPPDAADGGVRNYKLSLYDSTN